MLGVSDDEIVEELCGERDDVLFVDELVHLRR